MTYLYIIALGFALYAFFKFFAGYLSSLTKNKGVFIYLVRVLPVLEFVVWTAYFLWTVKQVTKTMSAYPIILAVLCSSVIVTAVWYFFRDFISGIILRVENGLIKGSRIKLSYKGVDIEGVVEKAGYRSLEVLNTKGEHIRIPYSEITGIPIIIPSDKAGSAEYQFNFEFSSTLEPSVISSTVKRRLMEMPWIVPQEDIRIDLKHLPGQDRYHIGIWYHSVTQETSLKTEEILSRFLSEIE